MQLKPVTLVIAALFSCLALSAFSQSVVIQNTVSLPRDTVIKNQLISSLNGFLQQNDEANKQNKYVLKEDLLETSALLDEMKGMDQNVKLKDKSYFKCYLTNVVKQDEHNFTVQISYIGLTENMPVLRASFRLKAKKSNGQFYFASPLKQNTAGWKTKKMSNVTYHYKDTLSKADAKAYLKAVSLYDKKLNAPDMPIDFYYCDNFPEVLQVTGIDYKADYNGIKTNNLSSHENNANLLVNGWNSEKNRFDPHDLWHERLRTVMNSDVINRPVDEGCAYLYGGSWGYSWSEILVKFKKYAVENPNADWLKLYVETTNFESGEKPLKSEYVLNALIAQKIEKEKGFAPVMELLGCGKREAGDENYFKALEKLTGITKAKFNAAMWELIKGS